MASTYTDILRLVKPTVGELDGTWGDVVNAGLTSLVETAIAGTAAVTHDDTANYNLTTASGAADEARAMFLNITGTTSAARNVVCPTKSKLYFVKNATTGGYGITLKTTAGTGISVPNGKYMMLYCDGTNVVEAANYLSSPTFGAATATSVNKVALTAPATGSTLTIADGKTLTASNTLTLSGTDGSTLNMGAGGTLGSAAYTASTAYDPAGAAAAVTPTSLGLVIGTNVQAYDADLTTWAGVTPGTGVATALAVNTGSAGSVLLNGGALGTPSSGSLANCTAYPGTSALVTTGALNSGSITSGFGSIDVGTDAISGGAITGGALSTIAYSDSTAYVDSSAAAYEPPGGATLLIQNTASAASSFASLRFIAKESSNAFGNLSFVRDTIGVTGTFAFGMRTLSNSYATPLKITSTGINSTNIGATTPGTGAFTTLSASGQTLIGGASATVARVSLKQSADTHQGYGLGVEAYGNTNILTIGYNSTDGAFVIAPSYLSTGGYTDLIFKRGGNERARVTDTGFTVTGLLDLSAYGQIKFPATQNASSDANTLDDYDEYTAASAACTGAITTDAVWKLTKIGNQVTLTLPTVVGTATAAASFVFGTTIPAKYRPSVQVLANTPIRNNNTSLTTPGMILISTAGVISVYLDGSGGDNNFTNGQQAGFPFSSAPTVSWTI